MNMEPEMHKLIIMEVTKEISKSPLKWNYAHGTPIFHILINISSVNKKDTPHITIFGTNVAFIISVTIYE